MSNEIVTQQSNTDLVAAIKNSVYPDASEKAIMVALEYCRHLKLDIMLKPIHIIKYGEKETIVPGINLFRTIAMRSGNYVGQTEATFSETVTEMIGRTKVTFPLSCKVVVKRLVNGHIAEFSGTAIWKESYSALADKVSPTLFWVRRPFSQLEKCAEMAALRRAFPDLVGAQNTVEEVSNYHAFEDEPIHHQSHAQIAVSNTADEIKAKFAQPEATYLATEEMKHQRIDLKPDALMNELLDMSTGEVTTIERIVEKDSLLDDLKSYFKAQNVSVEKQAQLKAKYATDTFSNLNIEQLTELLNSFNKEL